MSDFEQENARLRRLLREADDAIRIAYCELARLECARKLNPGGHQDLNRFAQVADALRVALGDRL